MKYDLAPDSALPSAPYSKIKKFSILVPSITTRDLTPSYISQKILLPITEVSRNIPFFTTSLLVFMVGEECKISNKYQSPDNSTK